MSDFYNPISHKFLWILNLGGLGDCEPELLVSGNYFSVRLHSGQTTGHARDLSPFRDPSGGQSWKTTAHASLATQSAGKSRLKQQIPNVKSITERWRYFVDFLPDFESFYFPKRFIYLRGIAFSGHYRWNFRKARDFVYFIDPLFCIVASRAAFTRDGLFTSR